MDFLENAFLFIICFLKVQLYLCIYLFLCQSTFFRLFILLFFSAEYFSRFYFKLCEDFMTRSWQVVKWFFFKFTFKLFYFYFLKFLLNFFLDSALRVFGTVSKTWQIGLPRLSVKTYWSNWYISSFWICLRLAENMSIQQK